MLSTARNRPMTGASATIIETSSSATAKAGEDQHAPQDGDGTQAFEACPGQFGLRHFLRRCDQPLDCRFNGSLRTRGFGRAIRGRSLGHAGFILSHLQ